MREPFHITIINILIILQIIDGYHSEDVMHIDQSSDRTNEERYNANNGDNLHISGKLGKFDFTENRHSVPNEDVGPRTFRWDSCDKIVSPIEIVHLDISPDPIQLGHLAKLSIQINVTKELGNTSIEMDMDLKMMIDGDYASICYFIGYEYCYVDTICVQPYLTCPIKAGLLERTIRHPTPYPPYRIFGSFKATLVLRENGKDIKCLNIWFTVSDDRKLFQQNDKDTQ